MAGGAVLGTLSLASSSAPALPPALPGGICREGDAEARRSCVEVSCRTGFCSWGVREAKAGAWGWTPVLGSGVFSPAGEPSAGRGFEKLVGSAAAPCGWGTGDPGAQQPPSEATAQDGATGRLVQKMLPVTMERGTQ